jgi:endoplasmic reticulum-Golgi intermediate compartment protein 3
MNDCCRCMCVPQANHDIKKQRLGPGGAPVGDAQDHNVHQTRRPSTPSAAGAGGNGTVACGSCYGAESDTFKCCNTCQQVQQAYQAKGWVMTNLASVVQCKDDDYLAAITQQEGEGCHMWGHLSVRE